MTKVNIKKMQFFKGDELKNIRFSIIVIFILTIFAQLVDNAFNLITPTLTENFDVSVNMASWVPSIAGVGLAIGFLAFSSFCDFLSVRKLLWGGIILFIAPSILALIFQNNFYVIFVMRFFQAAGGISTSAIYLVLVAKKLPDNEKLIWMGLSTTSFMISTIIGSLAGGFLTENIGWQVIFYIPFFALLGVPLLAISMPTIDSKSGMPEPIAFLLLVGLAVVLNFAASMPSNWILWLVTGLLIPVFIIYVFKSKWLANSPNPIITKEMLKNKNYLFSLLATFLYYLPQVAISVLLPFMLEDLYGYKLDQVALVFVIPYAIAAVVASLAGKLVKLIGSDWTFLLGGSLIFIGFFLMAFLANQSIYAVSVFFTLIVSGYALSFVPLLNKSISSLKQQQAGIGVGIFNFVVRIALSLGISISIAILGSNLASATLFNFGPQKMGVYVVISLILAFVVLTSLGLYFSLRFYQALKNKKISKIKEKNE